MFYLASILGDESIQLLIGGVQDLQPHFKARTSSGQREYNTFQIMLEGKSQFKQWTLATAAQMNIYYPDVRPEELSAQLLVQNNVEV